MREEKSLPPSAELTERSPSHHLHTAAVPPDLAQSALDPSAQEVTWAAFRLVGADRRPERSVDTVLAVRRFTRLLEVGAVPGRASAFVDIHAPGAPTPERSLEVHLALGVWGPQGQTADDGRAFADQAAALLSRAPALYLIEPVDPAPLFQVDAPWGARITQSQATLSHGSVEASVVSRFDRDFDPWLDLCHSLLARPAPTRLRVSFLATELNVADVMEVDRQLDLVRELAELAERDRNIGLSHRARRLQVTLVDLQESYQSPLWVAEVALTSSEPLPEFFVRGVAASLTNQTDVIGGSDLAGSPGPVVAGRDRLVGGYTVEPLGGGLEPALRVGLPLRGGLGPRKLADVVSLTEAGLLFRWPVPAGGSIPTVKSRKLSGPGSNACPDDPATAEGSGTIVGSDLDDSPIRADGPDADPHLSVLVPDGVKAFGSPMVEASLNRLGCRFDEINGDFLALFKSDRPGRGFRAMFMVEGADDEIYRIVVVADGYRSIWNRVEALELTEEWNRTRRWPKVFLTDDSDSSDQPDDSDNPYGADPDSDDLGGLEDLASLARMNGHRRAAKETGAKRCDFVCESQVDLETGVHPRFLDHFTQSTLQASMGFWKWLDKHRPPTG
ncbi:MAG: YbjN domain-containing protein [Acidimicrobiales bacterium]